MNRVIVLGSANTDLTLRTQRLPRPGETVLGRELQTDFGGKGANQALASVYCKQEVLLIAKIGTDEAGNTLAEHLQTCGLPAAGIVRDKDHPAGRGPVHHQGRSPGCFARAGGDRADRWNRL